MISITSDEAPSVVSSVGGAGELVFDSSKLISVGCLGQFRRRLRFLLDVQLDLAKDQLNGW
jgi:hypothetical protein